MALFKIFRGPESELGLINPCHEGYAYFTEDSAKLFIDVGNGDPSTDRVQVNAWAAEILIDKNGNEIDVDDFLLKTAIIKVEQGGTGLNGTTLNALLVGGGSTIDGATGEEIQNPIKMVSIDDGDIVVGDNNNGIRGLSGTGVLYRLAGGAPTFGTLALELGGTGATNAAGARANLDVYSKSEVDTALNNLDSGVTVAYTWTIESTGWTQNGEKFEYTYVNTQLSCGVAGNVPPIITCTENHDEYCDITSANATPGVGIVFTIDEAPEHDIKIIIIDVR